MELFKASSQWSSRPSDERFATLQEMYDACKGYADTAKVSHVPYGDLRVEAVKDDVQIAGKAGKFAKLTHWAFGQLSRLVGAPADYLRTVPATLATQNLNWGLKNKADDFGTKEAQLLFHSNGDLLLRSVTSEKYSRIWNWEISKRLLTLGDMGWRVPPARPAMLDQKGTRKATKDDVLDSAKSFDIGIKEGDLIAPSGIYASDHDMFAFMVNEKFPIDSGSGKPMYKGFFAWNSEVGASSFGLMTFLYDAVCGNHIVWGAQNVREVRIKHVGSADARATQELQVELRRYSQSAVGDIEIAIKRARTVTIAAKKEDVLQKLFDKRIATFTNLEKAYALAEKHESVNGAPNTVWGMVSGLTRLSQDTPYADKRVDLDRQAGKLMEMEF